MNWLDIVIILWLIGSLFTGLRVGFIYKAGMLVGFVVGVVIASRYTPQIAQFFHSGPVQTAGIFFFILSLVNNIFGILAWLLNKIFKILSFIPLLKTLNRVAGGVLSVIMSCFIISSVLYVADRTSTAQHLGSIPAIHQSRLGTKLLKLSIFYSPLISDKFHEYIHER